MRWQIQPGNGAGETGSNVGSDFGLYRYSDTGAYLGQSIGVQRSTGLVTFTEGTAGVQIAGTNGLLVSNGSVTTNLDVIVGRNLSVGSVAYVTPGNGIQFSPASVATGAQYQCMCFYGNPNWNICYYRLYHNPGVWAGHDFLAYNVEFQMNNSGHFVANGVDLGSDLRTKTNLVPVTNASSYFAACQAFEYDRIALDELDGTPVHEVGLIAQDIEQVMPKTVVRRYKATEDDPEPMRRIDMGAMNALAAQAIGELLAKVSTLETRIAALEAV
jgi:hypothetical protein